MVNEFHVWNFLAVCERLEVATKRVEINVTMPSFLIPAMKLLYMCFEVGSIDVPPNLLINFAGISLAID
jgi:hypothetical protein